MAGDVYILAGSNSGASGYRGGDGSAALFDFPVGLAFPTVPSQKDVLDKLPKNSDSTTSFRHPIHPQHALNFCNPHYSVGWTCDICKMPGKDEVRILFLRNVFN